MSLRVGIYSFIGKIGAAKLVSCTTLIESSEGFEKNISNLSCYPMKEAYKKIKLSNANVLLKIMSNTFMYFDQILLHLRNFFKASPLSSLTAVCKDRVERNQTLGVRLRSSLAGKNIPE